MSEILHIRQRIFFILTKSQKCGFQSGKTMFFSHFLPFPVISQPKQGFSALEATFLRFRQKKKDNWSTFWYSSAGLKIWTPINKSRKINFIGGHTLLNKKCRKFYILGSEFFLFWWNRKNVASRAEKPCFGRKMTGNGRKWLKNMVILLWKPHFCDFVKIKKIRHLICKISDIFCLAKYDLRWSWFFYFYLWVSNF